jgi:hypothetical protein
MVAENEKQSLLDILTEDDRKFTIQINNPEEYEDILMFFQNNNFISNKLDDLSRFLLSDVIQDIYYPIMFNKNIYLISLSDGKTNDIMPEHCKYIKTWLNGYASNSFIVPPILAGVGSTIDKDKFIDVKDNLIQSNHRDIFVLSQNNYYSYYNMLNVYNNIGSDYPDIVFRINNTISLMYFYDWLSKTVEGDRFIKLLYEDINNYQYILNNTFVEFPQTISGQIKNSIEMRINKESYEEKFNSLNLKKESVKNISKNYYKRKEMIDVLYTEYLDNLTIENIDLITKNINSNDLKYYENINEILLGETFGKIENKSKQDIAKADYIFEMIKDIESALYLIMKVIEREISVKIFIPYCDYIKNEIISTDCDIDGKYYSLSVKLLEKLALSGAMPTLGQALRLIDNAFIFHKKHPLLNKLHELLLKMYGNNAFEIGIIIHKLLIYPEEYGISMPIDEIRNNIVHPNIINNDIDEETYKNIKNVLCSPPVILLNKICNIC